jgi:small acid-soluble spore protein F (minor alpha/beta-type SASP)
VLVGGEHQGKASLDVLRRNKRLLLVPKALALFLMISTSLSHTIHTAVRKGMLMLGRRRGVMSDGLKEEIAKELGFYDVVQKEGWGGIRAKDAGNMVKRAIEIAQQNLLNK